jgi:hypothetical protein
MVACPCARRLRRRALTHVVRSHLNRALRDPARWNRRPTAILLRAGRAPRLPSGNGTHGSGQSPSKSSAESAIIRLYFSDSAPPATRGEEQVAGTQAGVPVGQSRAAPTFLVPTARSRGRPTAPARALHLRFRCGQPGYRRAAVPAALRQKCKAARQDPPRQKSRMLAPRPLGLGETAMRCRPPEP